MKRAQDFTFFVSCHSYGCNEPHGGRVGAQHCQQAMQHVSVNVRVVRAALSCDTALCAYCLLRPGRPTPAAIWLLGAAAAGARGVGATHARSTQEATAARDSTPVAAAPQHSGGTSEGIVCETAN